MNPRSLCIVIAATALFALTSCGRGNGGPYAVLLWPSPESELSAGALLQAASDNSDRGPLTLQLPEKGGEVTLERFRVRLFEDRDDAEQFKEQFAQYTTVFARAQRQALPVRDAPENVDSRIVYRLRNGEVMKVLGRTDTIESIDGLNGYWYRVLTKDGSSGWVFSYHLEVFSGAEAGESEQAQDDAVLESFFSQQWRPVYFAEMLESGHIRIERFQPEYGLFPDRESQELRLKLPDHQATFSYDSIVDSGRNRYTFAGSSFQLIVRSESEISIQYTVDGRGYNIAMQTIDADISEVIESERERRRRSYRELLQWNDALTSNAYGAIRFLPERRFQWSGYDRLVPQVVPAGASSSGTVQLDVFITDRLQESFDGALRLSFDGADQAPIFLYELRSDGLRLVHVPKSQLQDDLIRSEPLSPLILFFSITAQ